MQVKSQVTQVRQYMYITQKLNLSIGTIMIRRGAALLRRGGRLVWFYFRLRAHAKPNILVILGPCTSRMEALPLGRAAEGATPAPGPSSEDTLAFEAASEPLSEQAPTLAPYPPASTSAQAMTPGEVLAAAAASTPVSPVSPLKRHGYNEIFGGAVPLMLARRAHRKHRPPLSPNSRATLERGWNSAPFSPTPPTLQGVKLARKEPWHDDAAHFVELLKMQDPPSLNNTRQARFWQSTARDVWSESSRAHAASFGRRAPPMPTRQGTLDQMPASGPSPAVRKPPLGGLQLQTDNLGTVPPIGLSPTTPGAARVASASGRRRSRLADGSKEDAHADPEPEAQ